MIELLTPAAVRVGMVSAVLATIHQEINGEYTCQISVPVVDPLAGQIVTDAIVKLPDANGTEQFFRLDKPVESLTYITATGWHISQDTANELIVNRGWENKAGSVVWPELLQAGIAERRFTGTSNIATVSSMKTVRTSLLASMIGDHDNSFLSRYGGELERNNYTLNMLTRLGADRGFRVMMGYNLRGATVTEDASKIVNRVIPTYLSAVDGVLTLPEVYISSPLIGQTAVPHAVAIHYGDIKIGAETDGTVLYPTAAAAETEVRARVAKLWADGLDKVAVTVDVDFVLLRDTVEYQDLGLLEQLVLGDTVRVDLDQLTVIERMVAYDWDSLNGQYLGMTLGQMRPSMASVLSEINTQMVGTVASYVHETYITDLVYQIANMRSQVANASGYYSTTYTHADGSMRTYWHDQPTLEGSQKIEYYPEPGTRVYTNTGWNGGDPQWTTGLVDGSLVMQMISTVGLNADWVKLGGTSISGLITEKTKTFTSRPAPPYKVGDIWAEPPRTVASITGLTVKSLIDNGYTVRDLMGGFTYVCRVARATGAFNKADWQLVSTDNQIEAVLADRIVTAETRQTAAELLMTQTTQLVDKQGVDIGALDTRTTKMIAGEIEMVAITNLDGQVLKKDTVYGGVKLGALTGLEIVSTISGKTVTYRANTAVSGYFDGNGGFIGGLAVVDGKVANVSSVMTNDPTFERYAVVGPLLTGGGGISYYNKAIQSGFIWALTELEDGGFALVDRTDKQRISVVDGAGSILLGNGLTFRGVSGAVRLVVDGDGLSARDTSGRERLLIANDLGVEAIIGSEFVIADSNSIHRLRVLNSGGTFITSTNGRDVFFSDSTATEIRPASSPNVSLGVDSVGVYKIINGVKTYL